MSKWMSRKLFVAVGSIITVVLTQVGLPEHAAESVTNAIIVIAGLFLGGQSVADAAGALKK